MPKPEQLDLSNPGVSVVNGKIVFDGPLRPITSDEAIVFAAYLVLWSQSLTDTNFNDVLNAIKLL